MGGINSDPTLPLAGSPLKAYQRFLFWAAGAGRDFLQDCVEAEKFKYECIGTLICLTATVAAVSMFMAVWLTWEQDLRGAMMALPIAVLWGCLIFTIDRFMVSSLRANASWSLRFWQAAPRIVLAVIIGVIISRPVEIKIFETEILKVIESDSARYLGSLRERIANVDASIRQETARDAQPENRALDEQIDGLREKSQTLTGELSTLQTELAYWQRQAEAEGDGIAGSGTPGEGERYRKKRQRAADYEERVRQKQAELANVDADLQAKQEEQRQLILAIDRKKTLAEEESPERNKLLKIARDAEGFGFLELNLALHRLAELPQFMPAVAAAEGGDRSPTAEQREVASVVSLTLWGITLLFIMIEVLPILTKLMAPAGQYDERMQSAPYAAQMISMQEMVAVARARASFLERYEHANSALYSNVFERLTGDDGRTETVMAALWEHLRGGLDETLTRLREHQRPFAAARAAAARVVGPAVIPAPEPEQPPRRGSGLGGRVLVSVVTTTFMFFVSYYYCRSQGIEFQEAINAAAAIAGLAFPLLTTILLRRSSSER